MTSEQRMHLRKIVINIEVAAMDLGRAQHYDQSYNYNDETNKRAVLVAAWEAYEQFILTIPFPGDFVLGEEKPLSHRIK